MSKHIILFLAANPIGTDRIALDREVRAIQAELERSSFGQTFELVMRWAAQPTDLRNGLSKLKPTVVHFSGHGIPPPVTRDVRVQDAPDTGTGGLIFDGPDGRPQPVSVTAMQEMFGAAGASVRLVVLSASYSYELAEALSAYVDCAVAFAGGIHDEAARAFMVGFYGGLADRHSIATAYRLGRAAIALGGLPDHDQLRLVVREGVNAEQLFLVQGGSNPDLATNVDDESAKIRDSVAAHFHQEPGKRPIRAHAEPGIPSATARVDGSSGESTVAIELRDIQSTDGPRVVEARRGRHLISVIGIDTYLHSRRWKPLTNAVSDARGAAALFERLGFVQAGPALLDAAATNRAIYSLVTDDLTTLGPEDSLVLFYAGHGGNRKHRLGNHEATTGYLIPVDAEDRVATWVELEAWLRAVALLPAKHILVILDACHSGIALDPVIKWRGSASHNEPLSTLRARRSRRIVTSALSDQRAMDSGPYSGHSLFTGCLIEALTHGLRRGDEQVATGTQLGLYVQQRVISYPHSQQTPDFGAFAFDERGEMVLSLALDHLEAQRDSPSAVLPVPTENGSSELDEDVPGSVELATASVGPSVVDRDDRTKFWASVEQLLDPPTTTRGARTRRRQAYRHGAFAGNVRLGVVANGNGAMRVHLWSAHTNHQRTLQSIEHEVLEGSITVPSELGPLKTRPAPSGEMLYLEFTWHRSGSYLRELDRVKECIQWFIGAARKRFK